MKHTKGIWRYSEVFKHITTSKKGIIKGSKGICDIVSFNKSDDEIRANAKLIAAAPELLKALSKIYKSWDNWELEVSKKDKDSCNDMYKLWKEAKQAIKKAT